ncbi:hypothetical protein PBAL39_23392 [Pedobacter sp. BAL39]|nr:hypothetical protein PBAL39_23392 [Pedobacter sp. BAL39]
MTAFYATKKRLKIRKIQYPEFEAIIRYLFRRIIPVTISTANIDMDNK